MNCYAEINVVMGQLVNQTGITNVQVALHARNKEGRKETPPLCIFSFVELSSYPCTSTVLPCMF